MTAAIGRNRFALASLVVVLLVEAACSLLRGPVRHPSGPGVDLNRASREELAALPGLTPDDVERIVAGRPYSSRDDIRERGIVPRDRFEKVAPRVYVGRPDSSLEEPRRAPPPRVGD
jgi:hypothetical protein